MAMRRYAAFLRGVSPMNCKMPALKKCFEGAGFRDVSTVLSSGNVVFTASAASEATLAQKAEGKIPPIPEMVASCMSQALEDNVMAELDASAYATQGFIDDKILITEDHQVWVFNHSDNLDLWSERSCPGPVSVMPNGGSCVIIQAGPGC